MLTWGPRKIVSMEGTAMLFKLTSEFYSLILSTFGEDGNPTGAGDSFSPQNSRPLRDPPNLRLVASGVLFPTAKRPGHEADHS
jgi:hypothetical protein